MGCCHSPVLRQVPVISAADGGDGERHPEGVRSGVGDGRAVTQARSQPADILPPEGEVRRSGSRRRAAAAATGRREPEAEATRAALDFVRFKAVFQKVAGPQAEREAMKPLERRACVQLEILRAMVRR